MSLRAERRVDCRRHKYETNEFNCSIHDNDGVYMNGPPHADLYCRLRNVP